MTYATITLAVLTTCAYVVDRCHGYIVAVPNNEDMVITCVPGNDPFIDTMLCRWDLKFHNESTLDNWLTLRVWPVYILLSALTAVELLLSSYVNEFLYDDLDENFNLEMDDEDDGEVDDDTDEEEFD